MESVKSVIVALNGKLSTLILRIVCPRPFRVITSAVDGVLPGPKLNFEGRVAFQGNAQLVESVHDNATRSPIGKGAYLIARIEPKPEDVGLNKLDQRTAGAPSCFFSVNLSALRSVSRTYDSTAVTAGQDS